jgi:hypothetical protein
MSASEGGDRRRLGSSGPRDLREIGRGRLLQARMPPNLPTHRAVTGLPANDTNFKGNRGSWDVRLARPGRPVISPVILPLFAPQHCFLPHESASLVSMSTGEDWSREEVIATVNDYMAMLRLEYTGQPYNKSRHNQALVRRLHGRSKGSVEFKHQNISAALDELGYFWIPGYKPRSNRQQLLQEEVEHWIRANPDFDQLASQAAEAMAVVPEHVDLHTLWVDPPEPPPAGTARAAESAIPYDIRQPHRLIRRDYAALEARNRSLGLTGELLALRYEQFRLSRLGHDRLADRVTHISVTEGDGAGFDILSFDPDGRERFIEVKTTRFAKETPFFASRNEVEFAKCNASQFHLYRVFDFKRSPRLFGLAGSLQDRCHLDPISYRCSLRG